MQCLALKRFGPGCSLLKWSPEGSLLFSTTVGDVFRVWNCDEKWLSDRWTVNSGPIKSACWSKCNTFLLFVTEKPTLYRLQFSDDQVFANSSSNKPTMPVADLTQTCVGQHEIGGLPKQLAWDPNGLYLAISFETSACIAIFTTCVHKSKLSISPLCFISGRSFEESPAYITFQSQTRRHKNTILTIGWSSGRIEYFPFINF